MIVASGTAALMLSSVTLIAPTTSSKLIADEYSIFAVTRISSGPMCCVRMWISRSTPSLASIAPTIEALASRPAASPISRPFISIISTTAMTINSTPMLIEPTASQRASPVVSAIAIPPSARRSPTWAPMSSSSTTGNSGCFVVRMKVHQLTVGALK